MVDIIASESDARRSICLLLVAEFGHIIFLKHSLAGFLSIMDRVVGGMNDCASVYSVAGLNTAS